MITEADEDGAQTSKLMGPDLGHDVVKILGAEGGGELLDCLHEEVAPSAAIGTCRSRRSDAQHRTGLEPDHRGLRARVGVSVTLGQHLENCDAYTSLLSYAVPDGDVLSLEKGGTLVLIPGEELAEP